MAVMVMVAVARYFGVPFGKTSILPPSTGLLTTVSASQAQAASTRNGTTSGVTSTATGTATNQNSQIPLLRLIFITIA
jgi:hypothetical protein